MTMQQKSSPPIVLMTDFGLRDPYVGVMKGVIAGISPQTPVIDLTHGVSPQNIRQGAFFLETSASYFPDGAIFVAVVDPGVGTGRRAIALVSERSRRIFIAPDNGLLSGIIAGGGVATCYEITSRDRMLAGQSATFHGRDIFSPAAAHLAAGAAPESLGDPIALESCARIPRAENRTNDGGTSWDGEIVYADIYGNLVTSLPADLVEPGRPACLTTENSHTVPLLRTYGDVEEGEALAYRGSSGFLEIAVRNGDASRSLGAKEGERVTLINRFGESTGRRHR